MANDIKSDAVTRNSVFNIAIGIGDHGTIAGGLSKLLAD
jgi:hypothetical protein